MKKRDWFPFVGFAIFIALVAFLSRNRNRPKNENIAENRVDIETTQATAEEEPSFKTIETLLKKQDLSIRRSNYVTVAAFGGSIILVGLTLLISKRIPSPNLFPSDDVFLISFGFAVMVAAVIASWLESRTNMMSIARARRWFTLFGYFLIIDVASIAITLLVLELFPSLHMIAFLFMILTLLSTILAVIFLARGLWIRIRD